MTYKVSSTELYDNQSIIVKMKRIEDKVDGAEESVSAAVVQAESAKTQAVNAAAQAQQAAGSIGDIAEQAQQAVNTANAASAAASAAVTQAEQKAQAVVDAAEDSIKMDIIRELGTDIETAKDKADLAYTTASGFGTAISNMQSAVNSTQQEMSGVRTTAQTASVQATQTQGNLDLHITQAANTYATKTEVAGKADSTEIAAVIDLVDGKLSKSQADAYYQPAGDYLTEAQGDAKYALKGQGGGDGVWGSITGEITDQEDLIQYVDMRTSGLVSSDTLNQETAWAKNTAVDEAKAYVDGKPFVNKEYVDNGLATNKTQCNNYTDNKVATMSGSLMQEISGKQPAGNYALVSQIPDTSNFITVTDAARDYQPKGDYATRSEITAVYRYRGTVSTKSQLPSAEMAVGDVYNVASTGINYAWDGSEWDALGMDVDLSDYVTTTQMGNYVAQEIVPVSNRIGDLEEFKDTAVSQIQANTTAIAGKADTNILIGVSNHVDVVEDSVTALEQRVAALEPKAVLKWSELPRAEEIQGEPAVNSLYSQQDYNGKAVIIAITDGTPMDLGTVIYDGSKDVCIMWAAFADNSGWTYTDANGQTYSWADYPSHDNDGNLVDLLLTQSPPPVTCVMHSTQGDVGLTVDVADSPSATVSTMAGKARMNSSKHFEGSWSFDSAKGYYTRECILANIETPVESGFFSGLFYDTDIISVSIHAESLMAGINAGFLGAVSYNATDNKLKVAALTNNTDYAITIIGQRV